MSRLRAAVRPLAGAAAITAVVTLVGLLVGRVFGEHAARVVAVALYLVGGLVCLVGLAGGLRASMRPTRGGGPVPRGIRRASQEEITDAMASSAFLIGIGFLAFLAAIVVDPNQRLW